MRKNDFEYFMKCLVGAGARMERHYFQFPVAGSSRPIFRERVYCYELYHQLRTVLGDYFPYKLDGEVDKAGHLIIPPTLGAKKPDFVVHEPGDMKRNLVIIQVKPVTTPIGKLKEDFQTLQGFLEKAKYYRAIMLVYGDGKRDLPDYIRFELNNLPEKYQGRLLLVWHRGPREKPVVIDKRFCYA